MWEYPAVRLRQIVPQGGPPRATTFIATGDGFEAGAQLFLVRAGGSLSRPDDVIETRNIVVASQNQLKFVGDLTDNQPGAYDAYLLLPSRGNSTLSERSSVLTQAYFLKARSDAPWCDRVLDAIMPEVPAALVPERAWSRIRKAAHAGPPITVGDLTLECHLKPQEPRIDLILRLLPSDRDAYLESLDPAAQLDATAAFLQRWADHSRGFTHVPWVDVESDLDDDAEREPFLGPGIEPHFDRSAEDVMALRRDPNAPAPVANQEVARAVLGAYPKALPTAVLDKVAAVIGALPPDGFVTGVGSLGSRASAPSQAARVIVSLPRAAVRPFFDHADVGWPIARETMSALLGSTRNRISLDLDVEAQRLAPRVARYYTFPSPSLDHPFLRETLAMVEERELALPTRLEAVREWIRHNRSTQARAARVLTIKVIADAQGLRESKAYLSFASPPA